MIRAAGGAGGAMLTAYPQRRAAVAHFTSHQFLPFESSGVLFSESLFSESLFSVLLFPEPLLPEPLLPEPSLLELLAFLELEDEELEELLLLLDLAEQLSLAADTPTFIAA